MRTSGRVAERDRRRADGPSIRHSTRRTGRQWRSLAAIAVGGGLGSVARHLIGQAMPMAEGRFPWATFVINVSGCLVLGALNVYLLEVWPPRRYVRPFWAVGFLGGFTTFSAFTAEIRGLLGRTWPLAAAYGVASLVTGLLAVWLGVVLARATSSRRWRRAWEERA